MSNQRGVSNPPEMKGPCPTCGRIGCKILRHWLGGSGEKIAVGPKPKAPPKKVELVAPKKRVVFTNAQKQARWRVAHPEKHTGRREPSPAGGRVVERP